MCNKTCYKIAKPATLLIVNDLTCNINDKAGRVYRRLRRETRNFTEENEGNKVFFFVILVSFC